VAEPPVTFAGLLRKLRTEARLTQEELAEAAALSPRSVSDLERGIASTPRRETVRLLADALGLAGQARAEFEAVARGRPVPAGPVTDAAAAMRTLPRDIASFTGRQQELEQLVEAAAGSGGVVGIHAIGGMAGVGKTAFAVHAAHRLADRFPGGQIFLPLYGHTPGQQPVDPADALASLLLTAGVPAAQVPPGLEARMALWRDRLAEKQLLLVLDDAASSEQVRPLLPGAGGSLVLVTSRLHLSALEDATAVSLDTLPAGEAAALLVRLAGRAGLSPDDPAVGEIARLCGYLPLAIGMVARQLHHHPAWTAAGRAAELAAAVDRLELMATENLSVVAAFNLSYENLSSERQRLFRRLGLHPGTDADAYAAAALDGIDLATARRHLEALYDQYLLTEPDQGRYRMHDLIRAHAYGLAERLDPDSDRKQAIDRLLDYYQHTAGLAESRLARQTRGRLGHPAATKAPAVLPDLPDSTRALSWERAERANLLACIDHVTRTNQHARVVILTASIAAVLQQDGPWTDAATRHAAAVRAARHLNHQSDVADGLIQLGVVQRLTGDTSGAAEAIGEALAVYRTTGDRLGQAGALNELGIVRRQTGDYPGAAQALDEALDISRDTGDHHVQANILQNMGAVKQLTGDFSGAAEPLEEALAIYRVLGDQPGLAATLSHLGTVRRQIADYPGAAQALDEALDISRDTGGRRSQANALTLLGEVRRTTGDYLGAAQALEEALDISREMGSRLIRANCLYLLGDIRRIINDNSGAGQALEEALDTYRGIGDRLGQANSLASTGVVRRQTGDNSGAAQALEEALDIYRAIGDRASEAEALNETATVYRLRGDLDQAEEAHRQALNLARDIDSPWDMAHAIAGLARCALAVGHITETETSLKQALEIFQQIGAAEATDVAAELAALQASADSASDSSSG